MNKYAYITVLTNMKYLPGVLALNKGLELVESKYPLYVLVPESKKENLEKALNEYNLKYLVLPDVELPTDILTESYWNETFFKLKAVGLTQFEKVILIDSDMLVLKNLDDLFSKPSYSAVIAGKTRHPEYELLNSGLMVVEPSSEMQNKLLKNIKPTVLNLNSKSVTGKAPVGDQDVFSYTLAEWKDNEKLHLPEVYNTFAHDLDYLCTNTYKNGYNDVCIVHFVGKHKPWMKKSLKVACKEFIKQIVYKRKYYNKAIKQYRAIIKSCLK